MTKKKILLLTTAICLLAATGCQKENTQEGVSTDFTVILDNPAGSDSKVTINELRKPCWELGDQIKINNSTDGAINSVNSENATIAHISATISNNANGPYYAIYPASAAADEILTESPNISLPRVQKYKTNQGTGEQVVEAPMAAYNPNGKILQFKNLCSVVKITVVNDKDWDMVVDSIHIEASNRSLCGTMQLKSNDESSNANYNTIKSETPYLQVSNTAAAPDPDRDNGRLLGRAALENAKRIVSLAGDNNTSIGTEINQNNNADFYMYLPSIPSSAECKLTIRVFTHPKWSNWTDAENEKVHIVYSRTTNNITLPRNQFWALSYSLSTAYPTFTSMKAFSVSGTSQVCFSRGQLQYYNPVQNASNQRNRSNSYVTDVNARFRFAPRQWSFLGQTETEVLAWDNSPNIGWREYFAWGTGDNPVYFATTLEGQHVTNHLNGTNYDWGHWLANLNGSNYHNNRVWRTPTRSEYDYVFKSEDRNATDHAKFAWATITNAKYGVVITNQQVTNTQSIYGCILIPDGVTASELKGGSNGISTFETGETRTNKYKYRNDNVYTTTQFEYLEAKGCIFFPCIGMFVLSSPNVGNNTLHRGWDSNNPQGRYWSETSSTTQPNTQASLMWFQSQDLDLTLNITHEYTSTSANYDDVCRYLNCVRLVCNYGTPYFWDPDQM